MNRLEWWGKEIGRLASKRIVEKIDDLEQSYHEDDFLVMNYALDYLSGNFGNMNIPKIAGKILGVKINEKIIEEINIISEDESDRREIYQHIMDYLFHDLGAMIENTKKDNYNWADLRDQVNHN
jgi:hypothetical protein